MKRIILVILLIPLFIWSQTDTEIRLVNFSALKALDQYLYSCDIETFDKKDSFEELFTSDAVLFNDFVASNNFGSNISLDKYIQNVWNTRNKRSSRNRKFFRPQINLKEIDFLYPDGDGSGYVDLYVKKRLEFRLKSYKISWGDLNQWIRFDGEFDLKFRLKYDKESSYVCYNVDCDAFDSEVLLSSKQEEFICQDCGNNLTKINKDLPQYSVKISSIESEKSVSDPSVYVFFTKGLFKNKSLITSDSIEDDFITVNDDPIKIEGDNIPYHYRMNPFKISDKFKYNNRNFRSTNRVLGEDDDYNSVVFMHKMPGQLNTAFYTYNNLDVGMLNSSILTEEVSPDYNYSLNNLYFSFSMAPFSLPLSFDNEGQSEKVVFFTPYMKFAHERSSFSFDVNEFPEFYYPEVDWDGKNYDRSVLITEFDENINIQTSTVFMSLQFVLRNTESNKTPIFSPYINLDLALLSTTNVDYDNEFDAQITGNYSQYFDAVIDDGIYDFGYYDNLTSQGNLEAPFSFFEGSQITLGLDTKMSLDNSISFSLEVTKQLISRNIITSGGGYIVKNPMSQYPYSGYPNDINSITQILTDFNVSNLYICAGLNFKF